jgi:hypothetical protein
MLNQAIVIDTPEGIAFARMCSLKGALRLETLGMNRRGRSVYSVVKQEFGFKGNKKKVLAQLEERIEEILKLRETQ